MSNRKDKRATKEQSGYMGDPGIYFRCGTCVFFKSMDANNDNNGVTLGQCAIVKGTVDAYGCCNLWSKHGHLDNKFLSGADIEDIITP